MIISNQRLRLAIDTSQMGAINNVLTGATPQFWNGVDLQFELAIFYGGSLAAIANFDSLTVDLKTGDPRTGLPLMSRTLGSGDLNQSLTLDAWNAGAAVDSHALVSFTNAETNLNLNGDAQTFWLVVSALTNDSPAHKIVLGATPLSVTEGGEGVTPPASIVSPGYYTAAQADVRFSRSVDLTAINTHLTMLDSEISTVSGVATGALPKTGGALSGALTLTGLSGVLKAATGLVAGGATTTDLTEGANLYWTQTRFNTALAAVAGAASGICPLDSGSFIPAQYLPAITVHDTFVVSSQAAMLALAAHQGDVAIRTDLNQSFILTNNTPGVLANWSQLLTPASAVTSVNSLTGAVTLTTTNLAEGTNLYYTAARAKTDAIAAALTGFSNATGGNVSAGDSVVAALGRLENRTALNDAKVTGADRVLKAGDTLTGDLVFSGTAHAGLVLNSLTDSQRAALSPANGMVIYNTTLSQAMIYNGLWQPLATGGGSTWLNGAGVPDGTLGANGNYYLDNNTGDVYLKAAGAWSVIHAPLGSGGSPLSTAGGSMTGTLELDNSSPLVIGLAGTPSFSFANTGTVLELTYNNLGTPVHVLDVNQYFLKGIGGQIFNNASGLVMYPGNAPATSTSAGLQGQIVFDASYLYVCTSTNTWKRLAFSTFLTMTTITGKIEDAAGVTLHATIDFVSQSTPLVSAGVITTNTDKTIRSNPSDGTFALELAAGSYQVTITAEGQSTTFKIAVPEGNATASIETLVATPLVYPFVAPNTVWNGQRAGHVTFIPVAPPPAPTTTEVPYPGGNIDHGDNRYTYWVSYLTPTGETVVSPLLQVSLNSGSPTPDQASRIFLQPNPAGVTAVRLWRTCIDHGHSYDISAFPNFVGLLATVNPATAYYDDWESTAEFAARVDPAITPSLINTTAGKLLSSAGVACAYVSDQGLAIPSPLIVQANASFPGSNLRFTQGVGLEVYNFDTQLWHTLICTGNPAQLGLTTGHS